MPISRQTLTQNGHSRPFKVIYSGVNDKPLRDIHIIIYGDVASCLKFNSEAIASEEAKIAILDN